MGVIDPQVIYLDDERKHNAVGADRMPQRQMLLRSCYEGDEIVVSEPCVFGFEPRAFIQDLTQRGLRLYVVSRGEWYTWLPEVAELEDLIDEAKTTVHSRRMANARAGRTSLGGRRKSEKWDKLTADQRETAKQIWYSDERGRVAKVMKLTKMSRTALYRQLGVKS
jgi:hypothetical protein